MSPEPAKAPGVAHIESGAPKRTVGYLHDAEPNFLLLLPPYPALDSKQDKIDVTTFRQMQVPDSSARWKLAETDDQMIYTRFSGALGVDLDAAKLPIVIHLLNRLERDVLDTAFDAKVYFNRPRPFQRFAVEHVCGESVPPQPEAHPKGDFSGSTYPSGHTAFGWGVALTLAEVAPDRAQILLARAREYGESRMVCAVHYPSDVAAGELIATAVVERLHSVPEFTRDLTCAQQEYAAMQSHAPLSEDCSSLEKALAINQREALSYRSTAWSCLGGVSWRSSQTSKSNSSSPAVKSCVKENAEPTVILFSPDFLKCWSLPRVPAGAWGSL
jgi:acid phosphatase (class A)